MLLLEPLGNYIYYSICFTYCFCRSILAVIVIDLPHNMNVGDEFRMIHGEFCCSFLGSSISSINGNLAKNKGHQSDMTMHLRIELPL